MTRSGKIKAKAGITQTSTKPAFGSSNFMKKRHQQKLIMIAVMAWLAFNAPLILLFDSADNVLGFPLIYIYIFSVWLLIILISWFVVTRYYE